MAARATTANQVEPSLEDVDYNKWHTHAACHAILSLNFMLQIMVFWEDLTYHTVSWDPERQTVCRQITIYSVCPFSYFFQPHRVYTHTNTQKEMLKKKVGAKKRWERTCVAWKNKISLCPRHQQYHIKQAAIAAEDKNWKVRCKWWVSGDVRDISDRNSHFVDTAMFTRHVIEKREWQTCILCFRLWFCFLWYWQPFID